MEILWGFANFDHANVVGQMGVQSWCPRLQGESSFIYIGMGTLRLGVDTRIRSTRAMHHDSVAAQGCKSSLQVILYGVACCLALPALEGTPMVGDFELESHDTESSQP
jgi:hypothetical protein